jgi:hypothetical protein
VSFEPARMSSREACAGALQQATSAESLRLHRFQSRERSVMGGKRCRSMDIKPQWLAPVVR